MAVMVGQVPNSVVTLQTYKLTNDAFVNFLCIDLVKCLNSKFRANKVHCIVNAVVQDSTMSVPNDELCNWMLRRKQNWKFTIARQQ